METTTTCDLCGESFTGGHCENCEIRCGNCNCWFPREEIRTAPNAHLCENCFSDLCSTCDCCNRITYRDELTSTPGYNEYCQHCFDEHCTICHSCGDSIWSVNAYSDPNGNNICDSCADESCVTCESCSETIWRRDAVDCCDGYYCEGCAPADDDEDGACFTPNDKYNRMTSERRYGVEIETHRCEDYRQLGGVPFNIKEDCSVAGKEFASAILSGDKGLEAIEDLCDFAKDHDWKVNSDCGLHIHLDMTKEKTESLKSTAIAYLMTRDFWLQYVTGDRHHNHYCGSNNCTSDAIIEVTNFTRFSRSQSRYEWVNFAAYDKYKTFEIRVHQGSIDAKQICNWIRIHALFIDWATSKTCAEILAITDWNEVMVNLCPDDLVEYYHLTPAEMMV